MEEGASFGYWIRRHRKAGDLTQVELAARVGVSVAMIRRLEADERRPSKEVAARLAQVLAIPVEDQATFLKVARAELAADHLPRASTAPMPVATSTPHTSQQRQSLPAQATSLIGRDHEVAAIIRLLRAEDVRIVTLTGPGGTGKTRLALAVAHALQHEFADGVWFVDLAPIGEAELVAATIAATLELRPSGGQPLAAALAVSLQAKQILLLLDNFEQVLAAAPLLADLLKAAPHLKLLVTSRAVLHLSGEHDYPVPPLALPTVQRAVPFDQIGSYAAIRLFTERARAIKHDFQLSAVNAGAVLEVCRALDGLPLAIELAAARSKVLPPQALLPRLQQQLQILRAAQPDHPPRHHTLRAAIDWSYNLLDAAEQRLFTRLAVFVGGWTLAEAEAICGGTEAAASAGTAVDETGMAVLDGLQSLLDKSLVRQSEVVDDEPRFTMLDTIRAFAVERLETSDEAGVLRERHARYFLALSEIADKELRGPGVTFWTKRLLVEQHNLRAALDVTLGSDGAAELSLRLATALWFFWWLVGFHSEGQGWLNRALQGPGDVPVDLQARALVLAADLAWRNGDLVQAAKLSAESLGRFRDLGDDWGTAFAVMVLGHVAEGQGDSALAQAHFEESLARFQALGDTFFTGSALFDLGELARAQGELTQASVLYEQSLALYRVLGHARAISFLATVVAEVAQLQGQHRHAAMLYAESLRLSVETGALSRAARNITRLAELAQAAGELERAARLEGAAEGVLEASSNFQDNNDYFHWPLPARTLPEAGAFAVAWAEGRAMTLEQVVAYALAEAPGASPADRDEP